MMAWPDAPGRTAEARDHVQRQRSANRIMSAVVSIAALVASPGGVVLGQTPSPAKGPAQMDKVRFEPVGYEQIHGWAKDDHLAAFRAFVRSARECAGAASTRPAG